MSRRSTVPAGELDLSARQSMYVNDKLYQDICRKTIYRLAAHLGMPNVTIDGEPAPMEPASHYISPEVSPAPSPASVNPLLVRVSRNSVEKNEFYMQLALAASLNSQDPKTQVGCVIVDAMNHLVSVGYNRMPQGVNDHDGTLWDPSVKNHLVVHAEKVAIGHAPDKKLLKGATVYITLFPCRSCAQALIDAEVGLVVYWSYRVQTRESEESTLAQRWNDDTYKCAALMLQLAGVQVQPFNKPRVNYDETEHVRIHNLVKPLQKQVILYHALKRREMEIPTSTWPMLTAQTNEEKDELRRMIVESLHKGADKKEEAKNTANN